MKRVRQSVTAMKKEAHEWTNIKKKPFLIVWYNMEEQQHNMAMHSMVSMRTARISRLLTSIGFGKTRRLLILLRLTTECGSRLMALLCICSDSILCMPRVMDDTCDGRCV